MIQLGRVDGSETGKVDVSVLCIGSMSIVYLGSLVQLER